MPIRRKLAAASACARRARASPAVVWPTPAGGGRRRTARPRTLLGDERRDTGPPCCTGARCTSAARSRPSCRARPRSARADLGGDRHRDGQPGPGLLRQHQRQRRGAGHGRHLAVRRWDLHHHQERRPDEPGARQPDDRGRRSGLQLRRPTARSTTCGCTATACTWAATSPRSAVRPASGWRPSTC